MNKIELIENEISEAMKRYVGVKAKKEEVNLTIEGVVTNHIPDWKRTHKLIVTQTKEGRLKIELKDKENI